MSSIEEARREMKELEEQFAKELENRRKEVEEMEERAENLKKKNKKLESLLLKMQGAAGYCDRLVEEIDDELDQPVDEDDEEEPDVDGPRAKRQRSSFNTPRYEDDAEEDEFLSFPEKIKKMEMRIARNPDVFKIYYDPRYGHRSCLWDPSKTRTEVQEVRKVPDVNMLTLTGTARAETHVNKKYKPEQAGDEAWERRRRELLDEHNYQLKLEIIEFVPARERNDWAE